MSDIWLVWSNEHRAWWGPGRHGYTTLTDRAGRYSREAAEEICAQANIVPRDPPNEVAVLAPRPIRTGNPAYDRVSERLRAMDQAGEPPFDKEPR